MTAFDWVAQILGILAAIAAAPLFLGWVNQCRAWLQNRTAPNLLQPYRNIRKLFFKDAVIAANASPAASGRPSYNPSSDSRER